MAISIPLITTFDNKGIKGAIKEFKSLEGAGAKAQFALGKASKYAAATLAGLGAAAFTFAKAAAEDQTSQLKLAEAMKKTGLASEAQIKSTEDYISKLSMTAAIADDELRPAMANLVRATGDVTTAQEGLSLATDIAAQTGQSVESVSKALSKAYAGNTGALKKLNPALGNLIDKGASVSDINKVLTDQFGGSAAKAANTAEGQMKKLTIGFDEAKESIGAALLPALNAVIPVLTKVGDWIQKNPETFKKLAIVIGSVAAAIVTINTALKIYKAIQTAVNAVTAVWNALMAANPVVLVVAGIVALVAALVIAYKKVEWFRDAVNAVFGAIADVAGGIFDGVVGSFKWAVNAVMAYLEWGFNKMVDGLNIALNVADVAAGPTVNFDDIPHVKLPRLAEGGIVTAPTVAMIGERGPEAIIPLNRAGAAMGNVTIHVNGGDPQAVVDALRRYMRTNGAIPIRTTGVA